MKQSATAQGSCQLKKPRQAVCEDLHQTMRRKNTPPLAWEKHSYKSTGQAKMDIILINAKAKLKCLQHVNTNDKNHYL